ncbi:extradiol ring-cleavage dioxygenase [Mycobacterium helveticum]|uniref:Extradiol ring-cleavage dioxygenase n=1 Tax=Mycobacterium helveticum TaxID=2592811 RepID=A0A557XR84_9MYCO|nr:extradiol ring-cleavage dioxygenase [Mycobacterium helveticum]TVS85089.1 extradiol ring-cleavage dioxygenase [Mycobacterium helveticum]TVS88440.1 extradiol ring-cleavage dioxygenase [Mycobacterium helveticum]
MAEILGIGLSHYPPLSGRDEDMAGLLRLALDDPAIPAAQKDPANWPELMCREWGSDEGRSAAAGHRAALVTRFEHARKALDEFAPDVVLIWGDDQYENFREDIIPPYSVQAYDDMEIRPWAQADHSSNMAGRANAWNEPADTTAFKVRGRRDIAKHLVTALLDRGIDIAYAYEPLHHPGLPHAFLNAILYLDYHRTGFDYPVIAFPINCYGRRVISYRGFASRLDDVRDLDPPSPQPARMMAVGAAVGQIMAESPWRVALVASSSWSHAFLCDKTYRLRPDTASDRYLYDRLAAGDVDAWRAVSVSDLEESGQQELLNWFPLLGAMDALGSPTPSWSEFVGTDVFNSNKVFAIYQP